MQINKLLSIIPKFVKNGEQLKWDIYNETNTNPFGERVDNDFAMRSKSKPNTKRLLKSNKILIKVHLERRVIITRHCKNPIVF